MMTLLDLFAGMAVMFNDILAVGAVLGSAWVLIVIVVNAVLGKQFKFLSQLEGALRCFKMGTNHLVKVRASPHCFQPRRGAAAPAAASSQEQEARRSSSGGQQSLKRARSKYAHGRLPFPPQSSHCNMWLTKKARPERHRPRALRFRPGVLFFCHILIMLAWRGSGGLVVPLQPHSIRRLLCLSYSCYNSFRLSSYSHHQFHLAHNNYGFRTTVYYGIAGCNPHYG